MADKPTFLPWWRYEAGPMPCVGQLRLWRDLFRGNYHYHIGRLISIDTSGDSSFTDMQFLYSLKNLDDDEEVVVSDDDLGQIISEMEALAWSIQA